MRVLKKGVSQIGYGVEGGQLTHEQSKSPVGRKEKWVGVGNGEELVPGLILEIGVRYRRGRQNFGSQLRPTRHHPQPCLVKRRLDENSSFDKNSSLDKDAENTDAMNVFRGM